MTTRHTNSSTYLFYSFFIFPLLKFRSGSFSGGNTSHLGKVDGVSQWEFLRNSEVQSPRRRLLVNINERTDEKAFIMGKWKYVKSKMIFYF